MVLISYSKITTLKSKNKNNFMKDLLDMDMLFSEAIMPFALPFPSAV